MTAKVTEEGLAKIRRERANRIYVKGAEDKRPQIVKDYQKYKTEERAAEQQKRIDGYAENHPEYQISKEVRKLMKGSPLKEQLELIFKGK